MIADLSRAFGELRDPRVRGVVLLGVAIAVLVLLGLFFAVEALLDWLAASRWAWLDRIVDVAGALGTVVVAWFLFPAAVVAIASLFLDRVVEATERRYFSALPPGDPTPLGPNLLASARLLVISLVLNLLALPIYFLLPGINLPLWLALNGYLIGREYFELVALRRMRPAAAGAARHANRFQVWLAGVVIAAMLAVPILNLAAPVIGAAFMTLRFHRARPAANAAS